MELFQTRIKFLGHIIEKGQIYLQPHAVEFASKFPDKILDKTQLQRFLGSLNYVSHFYKDCAKDRRLLNQRLQKEPMPWTENILKLFETSKLKSGTSYTACF
jgi:hypothetical protein